VNITTSKVYGNPFAPTTWGSGGGSSYTDWDGRYGGRGGGATKLVVQNLLTIDGSISANGEGKSARKGGGGAGGSVWLQTKTLAGAGFVLARGGSGDEDDGGGGGGRIAVYYETKTGWTGTVSAAGGEGEVGNWYAEDFGVANYNFSGGPGTVFWSQTGGAKTLVFDNSYGGVPMPCTLESCVGVLDLSWSQSDVDIELAGGAMVVTKTPQSGLGIRDVLVRTGTGFVADRMGHKGSSNNETAVGGAVGAAGINGSVSGMVSKSGSGGAHAGAGGASQNQGNAQAGGSTTYGSIDSPVSFGSGGGGAGRPSWWGDHNPSPTFPLNSGGGAVYMNIGGTLTLQSGSLIRADGGAAWDMPFDWYGWYASERFVAGGGAGGSVWIQTNTLSCPGSGTATLSAKGGKGGSKFVDISTDDGTAGGGGGGGGGRVSVTASTVNNAGGCTVDVSGGAGGTSTNSSPGSAGSAGTKRLNGANW
jgi:hypothetical protein